MTGWVEELIRNMGYWGLFFLSFLENIVPPIPSEVVLPLGGYLSTQQQEMNFWGVVLAGTAGSVLGAILLYALGRIFRVEHLRAWAEHHGHWILLDPEDIDQAMDWFNRHGKRTIFFARVIPGVRSFISIPAGSTGMNIGIFLLYTTAGTAIWTTVLVYAGRVLGQNYDDVGMVIQWATYGVIAMFLGSVVWWVMKKRKKQQAKR